MNLMIGIPAYNESKTLSAVIKKIPKKIPDVNNIYIVVVDDGSNDKTSEVAVKNKVHVIRHLVNRGLGGSLKTLFAFAKESHFDILVTLDADGQHNGEDIHRLIKPLLNGKADVVIGSRWMQATHEYVARRLVNQLANLLTYMLFGVWCSDTQSGMRSFNKKSIRMIQLQSDGMEISSEFFKEIYRNKLRLKEIPIQALYTSYSRKKGQKITNTPIVFFQLLVKFFR